jgi:hypothetical protein
MEAGQKSYSYKTGEEALKGEYGGYRALCKALFSLSCLFRISYGGKSGGRLRTNSFILRTLIMQQYFVVI